MLYVPQFLALTSNAGFLLRIHFPFMLTPKANHREGVSLRLTTVVAAEAVMPNRSDAHIKNASFIKSPVGAFAPRKTM